MSQTISHRPIDESPKIVHLSIFNCCGKKEEDEEVADAAGKCVQRKKVRSACCGLLVVSLKKNTGRAGSAGNEEVINRLHTENYNLSFFKQRIKISGVVTLPLKV